MSVFADQVFKDIIRAQWYPDFLPSHLSFEFHAVSQLYMINRSLLSQFLEQFPNNKIYEWGTGLYFLRISVLSLWLSLSDFQLSYLDWDKIVQNQCYCKENNKEH